MNFSKPIIVCTMAMAMLSCKQKSNNVNTADTATTRTDSASTDTIRTNDTSAVDIPGDKPVPLKLVIVPGVSLGQSTINESSENIYKRLGKPDAGDAAMGKSIGIWYANHDTTGYVTQMYFSRDMGNDETSRLKQVRVTSPDFKVNNKIHVGAALGLAQSLYKLKEAGTFTYKGAKRTLYDDNKAGISFETDDKRIITGITVHEPGRDVATTFLPFFASFKAVE